MNYKEAGVDIEAGDKFAKSLAQNFEIGLGDLSYSDMAKVFNLGVGMVLVLDRDYAHAIPKSITVGEII